MQYMTVKKLRKMGVCEPGIHGFRHVFGERCLMSKKNILKALEAGLQVFFVARHLPLRLLQEITGEDTSMPIITMQIKEANIPEDMRRYALMVIEDRASRHWRASTLSSAFNWGCTPEGHRFWGDIRYNSFYEEEVNS